MKKTEKITMTGKEFVKSLQSVCRELKKQIREDKKKIEGIYF